MKVSELVQLLQREVDAGRDHEVDLYICSKTGEVMVSEDKDIGLQWVETKEGQMRTQLVAWGSLIPEVVE